jgi:hypothetical protein
MPSADQSGDNPVMYWGQACRETAAASRRPPFAAAGALVGSAAGAYAVMPHSPYS